jgi:hypothetical protein
MNEILNHNTLAIHLNHNQSPLKRPLPLREIKTPTLIRSDNSIIRRKVRILDIQRLIRLYQVEFSVESVGGLALGKLVDTFALGGGSNVLETFEVEDCVSGIVFDLFLVGFDDLGFVGFDDDAQGGEGAIVRRKLNGGYGFTGASRLVISFRGKRGVRADV